MKYTQIAAITNPVINSELTNATDGGNSLGIIMANLYQTIVMVGGLAVFLFLIRGGISWITAGGDKAKLQEAKDKITNAIVGMAILVAIIAIINILSGVFGYDLLNPTIPSPESINP